MLPSAHDFWLRNVRIPHCFLDETVNHRSVIESLAAAPFLEDLVAADLQIQSGQIAAISPVGTASPESPSVDLARSLVLPCFVDLHTHLDKGHIWPRQSNPDGTFDEALAAVMEDASHWDRDDLYQRMEFSLRCAYAHGTQALRTHFDAFGAMAETALEVLAVLQSAWRDRLIIQAVSLVSLDYYLTDQGEQLAQLVAEHGGILGGVAYPNPDLTQQLDRLFDFAAEYDLALDLHVDESLDPASQVLRAVAETKLRHSFENSVVCGHCCSLSVQSTADVAATLERVKAADIGIVSLPMCNLYLQDRQPGLTPRYRGVTILHELKAAGIPVAIASDNTRDPFYAYGDLDGLEVLTHSTRIAHLDRPIADWPLAITRTPADLMGLPTVGRIGIGQSADLILFKARSFSELFARPQSDRVVLRQGQAIDTTLPDYAELDALLGAD
ncbi:cytosine deaminase [Leptolyngbya iicbica]|uniref:Cytosine deaminase n=2 Tax=Cyanophyceae TaxID=3028117 RepID=A0A4Q7E9M4_9CYAN|nr:cytosine deaminase [Leptolyngbya sp. LK]RZM79322.1 cytosine deaminase [Leptolyngbya sp. LK]